MYSSAHKGLTMEEISSVADKLLDETIWFFVPLNHPTNATKLNDYYSKLKTNRTLLEAMVTYCQSHVEKLNENTFTTFNILENYEINDIIFSKFCNMVEGFTHVKRTHNTKIESLSHKHVESLIE